MKNEKDIPLLDCFYEDVQFLTADKCVKAETKQAYHDKVLPNQVKTAVLFWGYESKNIPNIMKDCELIVDDVAWQSYLWKKKILFVMLRIGAPTAAASIEELRIYGIENFIAAGTAGCIEKNFDESKVVVVTRAIRDEGTSYHYLPASTFVDLDKKFADNISKFLNDKGVKNVQGTTWTTDGFYRETKKRIQKRIEQGALGVEMECAALTAATKFHKVNFGQFIWFSDKVDGGDWSWLDTHEERKSLKEKMLLLALDFAETL